MTVETRWSRYRRGAPTAAPRPPQPWPTVIWEMVWGTAFVVGAMAFMVFVAPFIKLGMYHWLVFDRFRKGEKGAAIAIFVFACLAVDSGLILGAVMLAQGEIELW